MIHCFVSAGRIIGNTLKFNANWSLTISFFAVAMQAMNAIQAAAFRQFFVAHGQLLGGFRVDAGERAIGPAEELVQGLHGIPPVDPDAPALQGLARQSLPAQRAVLPQRRQERRRAPRVAPDA